MKTKLCSSALWFLDKALHIVLQQLSCTNPKVFVAVPILVFRIYDEPRCHSKGLQQTVVFFYSTVCLLILLQKCCTVSKKQKTMCFFGQYSVFVNFLAKVLYCPKKTNPFLQKCCTVPKKPKKTIFSGPGTSQGNKTGKDWFFWFFGTVQHFCKKRLVFLGQYSVFVNFLAKVLYCPKKANLFLQKCCTVPKNQKNQSFPVLLPCEVPGPEKIVFFGFFGTVQHFSKKNWLFWDSTVFLLIFLQKCCTVPKKPIFFCKSAVLFQKNPSCGRPVVGSSLKTGKNGFFCFFGTVQHFCKKGLVFLGQYSVFC